MKILQSAYISLLCAAERYSNIEIGALLGGHNGIITTVELDINQNGNHGQYVMDTARLNQVLRNWHQQNVVFYGIWHTHPNGKPLSDADRITIQNIMDAMPEQIHMEFPITVPALQLTTPYKAVKTVTHNKPAIEVSELTIIKEDHYEPENYEQ